MNFPTIAAATISTSLRGRNIDGNRGTGRRRPTPSLGSGTYSDEVISLLGSAHIASPSVWRDKEINHLFGCTSQPHFRALIARDEAPPRRSVLGMKPKKSAGGRRWSCHTRKT